MVRLTKNKRLFHLTVEGKLSSHYRSAVYRACRHTLEAMPSPALSRMTRTGSCHQISLSLVGTARMKRLNGEYRGNDRPTDVLSFAQYEHSPPPAVEIALGDLVLCEKVIRANAKRFGVSYASELSRMTVHGLLHLFGYDHEQDEKQAREMFRLQERIVSRLCH